MTSVGPSTGATSVKTTSDASSIIREARRINTFAQAHPSSFASPEAYSAYLKKESVRLYGATVEGMNKLKKRSFKEMHVQNRPPMSEADGAACNAAINVLNVLSKEYREPPKVPAKVDISSVDGWRDGLMRLAGGLESTARDLHGKAQVILADETVQQTLSRARVVGVTVALGAGALFAAAQIKVAAALKKATDDGKNPEQPKLPSDKTVD